MKNYVECNNTELSITAEVTSMSEEEVLSAYDKHFALFWSLVAFSLLIAAITIIGNGLVIYATYSTKNLGRLRYLDGVVRSLAFTDLLFGLLGTPLVVINYYKGKLLIQIDNNISAPKRR